ncbi:hypothetical protein AB0L44_05400 [Nonomuraea wenchangensis]|uniref:hypothetical protein n=1 Tax=Nonomuraea wenchangensis TaxID=568860 RepID=UPI0034260528
MPFDDFDRSRQRGLDDHLRRIRQSDDDSRRRRESWDRHARRQNSSEGMSGLEIVLCVVAVVILLIIMASR